ncbi:hypothetical protein [uncultured Pseudokineococcus sp.]|uniref:hypothetical protein n=1 Tax=uncultured Pseudokineococcus sp. TaxID=1642928 RepID=UPI00262AAE9F|nr:hypothetical protein [uncultured Pseudokineococcus sp.]
MEDGTGALVGAVITASAAVLAVVVAQLATARRERRQRVYARERAALLDAQDAALVARTALRAVGTALERAAREVAPSAHVVVAVPTDLEAARSEAEGRLDVRLARVATRDVVDAARAWQQRARWAFLGDEDVTARDEDDAWGALNAAVAAALDDRGWWERRRGR